jgi:SpoVK/Ycf46/Vps4 family AAA+-type ATPase
LFIDEAYSLASSQSDSYGEEAIDILLKRMETTEERLVVILAGYTTEMENFIDSNPGLKSRFSRYIKFDDYDTSELYGIFDLLCKENEYKLSDDASKQLRIHFDKIVSSSEKNFGNGRYVRNIFEKNC